MAVFISNTYEKILSALRFLIAVFAAVLVVVVFSNVICRYFLQFAIAWAEETARFLFIWLAFMGAVVANANNEHMKFDLLVSKLPKKTGALVTVLANGIILVILFLIIKGGFTIVRVNSEWMTPVLEIPYGAVYSIVPVCGTLLLVQFLSRMLKAVKVLIEPNQLG